MNELMNVQENVYEYDGLIKKIQFWREKKDSRGIRNLHWTQMSSKCHYGTHLRYDRAITTVDLAMHLGFRLEETHMLASKVVNLNEFKSGIHKYYVGSRIDRNCKKSSSWKGFDESSFVYETDPTKAETQKYYWLTEKAVIKLFAYLNKIN